MRANCVRKPLSLGWASVSIGSLFCTSPGGIGSFAHVQEAGTPLPTTIALYGSVLDEEFQPLADANFLFLFGLHSPDIIHHPSQAVRSDENGGFRLVFDGDIAPEVSRVTLEISADWSDEETCKRLGKAEAFVDFGGDFAVAEHNLGLVVLLVPGSNAVIARMSDADLEVHYRAVQSRPLPFNRLQHQIETCLTEMIRRGGSRWIEFLQRELDALRIAEEYPKDLEMLTALRRVQGLPDPLLLEITDGELIESTFPHLPELTVRWRNIDEYEDLTYREGQRAWFRVEAVDEEARIAPHPQGRHSQGSSRGTRLRHPEGKSWKGGHLRLDLMYYVALLHPGDYQVRVQNHPGISIASEDDVRGWILSSSKPVTVRLHPLHIRLDEAERAELLVHLQSIDVLQPVVLLDIPGADGMESKGTTVSSAERLFRAGWRALPLLIDALEDPAMDVKRRAWLLGLLYDLTGWHLPWSERSSVIGSAWTESWDSPAPADQQDWSESIDPQVQSMVVERWRESRSCVVLD